jgi:glycosyltransferase involved in cell wall biosynthesis
MNSRLLGTCEVAAVVAKHPLLARASIGLALDRLDRRRHHIFGIWIEGLVKQLSGIAGRVSVIRSRKPNRPMDFGDTPVHELPRTLGSHYAYATFAPRYFEWLGLDLVHFPFLYAPYFWTGSRVARIVTIHGSARQDMPYEMRKRFGFGKHGRMIRALAQYDQVIAVSESARREAIEYYRLDPGRVQVVPDAIGNQFSPAPPNAPLLAQYKVRSPYILSLCTLRPKKNVATTVDAFAELRRRGAPHTLVLVGDKAPGYTEVDERIAAHGLGDAVVQTGFVPAAAVPAFYQAADLLVFPSFHEGFGLPVAEAMACGCPVVASNAYAIPEVAGDAALLVDDPKDAAGFAASAWRVLTDDALRSRLRERGFERVKRFRWDSVIEQVASIYERALVIAERRRRGH